MTNHAHILLRCERTGMPDFMRRLLTGYASAYNRSHKPYGHVFQLNWPNGKQSPVSEQRYSDKRQRQHREHRDG